jgi:hypothetical protein
MWNIAIIVHVIIYFVARVLLTDLKGNRISFCTGRGLASAGIIERIQGTCRSLISQKTVRLCPMPPKPWQLDQDIANGCWMGMTVSASDGN